MKVKDILAQKGTDCESIAPDVTVKEAIEIIATKRIGALVVIRDNKPVGIITERDIFRLVAAHNEAAFNKPVEESMTKNLVVGLPDDDIDVARAYMTNNRFRHLPIIDNGKICGIVSIGDIVKIEAKNLKVENRYLQDYITGKYPG
ncbi:MAG: CBS domain-containing protein [Candidatus Zixiibacteriota bacterium]